jgi:hypothetical protein
MGDRILEWDKEGTQTFKVDFADNLLSGVTLTGAPTVKLQQKTSENPETWADRSTEITVSAITVVDGTASEKPGYSDGTSSAVQFRIAAEAGAEPETGYDYRLLIEATRSDGTEEVSKTLLWIRP